MKKSMLIIIAVSIMIFILSGCMLSTNYQQKSINSVHGLGLKTLPSAFLNWWFSTKVKTFNPSTGSYSHKPLKLIASYDSIASTQKLLIQPFYSNIPYSYDLRDYSGTPPVQDQGDNDTCWAFATVESLESAMLVQLGILQISQDYPFISNPLSPDLSEQFVAYNDEDANVTVTQTNGTNEYVLTYQETNNDEGGYLFFSFYDLTRRGVPLASDFPYISSSQPWIEWDAQDGQWPQHLVTSDYSLVIPNAYWFYKSGYSYTDYINTIKSAIMEYGAVAVTFSAYNDFMGDNNEPSGWVYPGPSSNAINKGGHAVILIGWDDDWTYNGTDYGPVWILQNSWGTGWGHNGYWRQPMITQSQYDNLSNTSIPSWQIEQGSMYLPLL